MRVYCGNDRQTREEPQDYLQYVGGSRKQS
jgi:hypothetical protein